MIDRIYLFYPTRHPDALQPTAPGLAELLRGARFRGRAERFEKADRQAIDRQADFRRTALVAHGGMGVTTVLTAAALALPPAWAFAPDASRVMGVAAAVAGGVSARFLHKLRQGEMLRKWMEARAEAETERLDYFKTVVMEAPTDNQALLEQVLDYIRDYHVEAQKAFYEQRGQRHEKMADRLLSWATWAAALGGLGAGTLLADNTGIALLGVLCTAVAGFVAAQEGIGQDKRNAERYGRTWKFLSKIAEEEDAVREKVKAGDKQALVDWLGRLHEHLSLEHREWRAQGDSVEALLAEKPKGQPGTPPTAQG